MLRKVESHYVYEITFEYKKWKTKALHKLADIVDGKVALKQKGKRVYV